MEPTLFRALVIFLGLSHLLCLQAVPITRTESLMQGPQVHDLVLENTHKVTMEEGGVTERLELELHDYPPSGPNNRHTPRAP